MHLEGTHRDAQRGHFGSGFLVLVAETERETRAWLCRKHWGLSLSTFALDLLAPAGSAARQLARRARATVRFKPLWLPIRDY
jgi:hypothetical protein